MSGAAPVPVIVTVDRADKLLRSGEGVGGMKKNAYLTAAPNALAVCDTLIAIGTTSETQIATTADLETTKTLDTGCMCGLRSMPFEVLS